jgi:hypothetical protein
MLTYATASTSPDACRPYAGLGSLWEMIRIYLEHYVTLGKNIATLQRLLEAGGGFHGGVGARLMDPVESTIAVLGQLRDACTALGLSTSRGTIDATMQSFQGSAQISVLLSVVEVEMSERLFLYIPPERSKFWEQNFPLSDTARSRFPVASQEIRLSGTAYACALWSASVFHSMRAAEEALVSICDELKIERSGAEQWGNLIDLIEARLKAISKMPKASDEKRQHLQPLSELVVDLRLFKDAWRNQSAHNIVSYTDGNASSIMEAVCRVLEAVALRKLATGNT